ncbi:hypothetical protein [Catellatospora bangladeshensis]|uniref:Uncharacterized protein n=1 Tax=Catellatospora bangladeshensis TaxID=310355 RepID=A0A8J3JJ01_9ACTN|nr:hypothetical protein [Catellatospora bangladeshensis]GIF85652.1 hypothetical protein Cba03nite_70010 [Catellatospora bangladeshensis]
MTETTAPGTAGAADTAPPQDAPPDPRLTARNAGVRQKGLAVLTAVLAAALILRGPEDLAGLHWSIQVTIALLLAVAFTLLVRTVLAPAGPAAAPPAGVRVQAAAGLAVLGVAVLTGWLAPAPSSLMQVVYDHGIICGQVSLAPDGYITVDPDPGQAENRITAKARTLVPKESIHGMTEVRICEPPATVPTPAP